MYNETLPTDKCLPVEAHGEYYVLAQEWLKSDLPIPDRSRLPNIISSRHKKKKGRVLIGDEHIPATIFAASDHDDFSFAILDLPDSTDQPGIDISEANSSLLKYVHFMQAKYSMSEAILPEQRCYIESDFIEPTLHPYNKGSKAVLSWRQAMHMDRLLVVGVAGSGKTTLLRQWALRLGKEAAAADRVMVPIYVLLRELSPSTELGTHVKRELTDLSGQWIVKNFEKLAQDGHVAVAFDGLDEVVDERRSAIVDQIRAFVDLYPRCRFMISTRSGVAPKLFRNFTAAELLPFSRSQMCETVYH